MKNKNFRLIWYLTEISIYYRIKSVRVRSKFIVVFIILTVNYYYYESM